MKYGVDVGSVRVDDWDRLLLQDVEMSASKGYSVSVLEVGCGLGAQVIRLALAGATVQAIDVVDYSLDIIEQARLAGVMSRILFCPVDIRQFLHDRQLPAPYTFINMQRVLHYLPYPDAQEILRQLRPLTNKSLYVSVTGTTTAIATYYPHVDKPLSQRWGHIEPDGQRLFSMTAPVCLYSEKEILTLLEETGWKIARHRVSDFGNVKVIATPTSQT